MVLQKKKKKMHLNDCNNFLAIGHQVVDLNSNGLTWLCFSFPLCFALCSSKASLYRKALQICWNINISIQHFRTDPLDIMLVIKPSTLYYSLSLFVYHMLSCTSHNSSATKPSELPCCLSFCGTKP